MSNSVAYFTQKRILWPIRNWDKVPWLFPYLELPLNFSVDEIIKKNNIDFIFLHTQFAKDTDLSVVSYMQFYKTGRYQLIEFLG